MSGFLGADTDGLDDMAQQTESAGDAADAVAKALEALVAALEAMSWTGFAAAFAAYLKATVIPWVKVTAQALHAFSKVLSLASGGQKEVSAGSAPVATGSGPIYNPPTMPTTSTGTGPQLAPMQITITVSQGSNGAGGVQVSAPTMPGSTGAITGATGATGTAGSVVSAPPVSYTPAAATSTGTAANAATVATPSFTPTSTGSLGSGATGSGGTASAGGAGDGGSYAGSGAGASGGSTAGAVGGNPTASFGVHTLPGGGIGYNASISGTIGAPDPTSTPVLGAGSGGLGTTGGTPMPAVPSSSGGTSAAALAAPLGLAGLGAAGLGALRAGTSTTPATTTPATTPTEHWQAQLTTDEHGGARLLLHQAVDPLAAGADPDALLPAGTGPQAWIDADGDYGFSDAGSTVDGVTTHTVVEGNLVTNPDAAPAVTQWWDQALDGTSVQVTTPATPATATAV